MFQDAGLESSSCESGWPKAQDFARKLTAEHSPNLIVVATSLLPGLELALIRDARARGIPCVAVLDSWTNYRARFLAPEERELTPLGLPDIITTIDDFSARELASLGFSPHSIRVTGQPAFDEIVEWAGSAHAVTQREELRSDLSIGPLQKLVVFFSQPIRGMYGEVGAPGYRGYDEYDALEILLETIGARRPEVHVVIKPHPKEESGKFESLLDKASPAVQMVTSYSANGLIAASDVVVGMTSVTLAQAMLIGRPTISLQPHLWVDDALVLGRMGALEPVTDPTLLPGALEQALNSGATDMADKLPSSWHDGMATARVMEIIEELLALSVDGQETS